MRCAAPLIRRGLAALMLVCAGAAGAVSPDRDLAAKQRELEQLRARIEQLRGELDSARGERDGLIRSLADLELAIGRKLRQLHQLRGEIELGQRRLDSLEQQRTERQRALKEQRRTLAAQLRAAHVMGRQERIKLLLNQQDPELVSRILVYYDYLNQARLRDIRAIRSGLEELRRLRQEIRAQQHRLDESQRQQRREMQDLERDQREREEVLAALETAIAGRGQDLGALERDQQQLEAFLQRLQQMLDQVPIDAGDFPFAELQGKLTWPVSGRLLVGFGSPRHPGSRTWDGVLIDAAEGSEVRAVHHGRVAFADWLRGLGLLLIVDHGNGYMTLYGQNQSLFKETGEWVAPGELVGLAGRSGGQSNAGVYFGIRHQGKPLNPRTWCQPVKGGRVG